MTSNGSTEAGIVLDGVTKRFRKEVAVDNLTLTIPRGSTLGFLGQNGAGKTTTIKMIMGLLRRDAGDIYVLGADPAVDHVAVKQRVGYVPEQQFIYRWMRVSEAIYFCRSIFPKWNDRQCDELLRLFRLDPNKKVKHMSKGMVVKLALLLALSHEPDVLVLDEPMAGLDPVAREELLDGLLRCVCDREQTLLFSSHTLGDVQRLAGTIGIIDEGRLLVHRDVDDMLKRTKRIRAVLSNGKAPQAPPDGVIWQRVDHREWLLTVEDFSGATIEHLRATNQLEKIEVVDIGLEDIFKDYVRGWRTQA